MKIGNVWAAGRRGRAELASGLVRLTLLIDSGPLWRIKLPNSWMLASSFLHPQRHVLLKPPHCQQKLGALSFPFHQLRNLWQFSTLVSHQNLLESVENIVENDVHLQRIRWAQSAARLRPQHF